MKSREEELQDSVYQWLESLNIYPFSVIFTFSHHQGDGMLSITTYLKSEIEVVLKELNYSSQCDKSGYVIFQDTNTLILTGIALIQLYSKNL